VSVEAPFRTAFPAPYPLQLGRAGGGWHWDLGGHLTKGGAGAIGCTTCHAVHGDEQAAPVRGLLAIEPVNDVANLFCEGCHAGKRGDGKAAPPHPNPGGTTAGRTYHPVDDDAAKRERPAARDPGTPEWPLGGGNPRRLVCTTCHTPHAAMAQTPAAAHTDGPGILRGMPRAGPRLSPHGGGPGGHGLRPAHPGRRVWHA